MSSGSTIESRPADASDASPAGPIRILAVGNMYPPHHAGGYELMWQRAMRRARALGHRVRVLASDYREDAEREEEDPDVYRTLRWYWDQERYEFPRLNLMQRVAVERHNASELRRHVEAFRPDIVTWWSMGCMSLSLIERIRRAGIPALFVVHDDWLVYGWEHDRWIRTWQGPRRKKLVPIVELVSRIPAHVDVNRAGAFVFNSRYTLAQARRYRLGTVATSVVHPGIDERLLETLPPQPWRWRLACVGRIDRQKGVDTAISALTYLPSAATLAVWGSGDRRYLTELKALAASLGVSDRVQFAGFASADGLRSAYAAADVVVFPVRWDEPFGLVPLEAMGFGRPLVATARGGTVEFVNDGHNALVFPADDAAALAGCVQRLASDELLRSRLCEEGRRTAAQYTAARFAERTVEEILRVAPSRIRTTASPDA